MLHCNKHILFEDNTILVMRRNTNHTMDRQKHQFKYNETAR